MIPNYQPITTANYHNKLLSSQSSNNSLQKDNTNNLNHNPLSNKISSTISKPNPSIYKTITIISSQSNPIIISTLLFKINKKQFENQYLKNNQTNYHMYPLITTDGMINLCTKILNLKITLSAKSSKIQLKLTSLSCKLDSHYLSNKNSNGLSKSHKKKVG